MIYRYALCFDAPIKLDREPKRKSKKKLAGILLVNRLIHDEALPILHELNTIVISREELCQFPNGKRPQLTCKPEFVQRLYIRNLAASSRCAARISAPWPATNRPCPNCRPSILGLVNTLRLKPKLKEVFFDYHGYHYAVNALMHALKTGNGIDGDTQLTCTGIGAYTLTGSWLQNSTFSFRDVPLAAVWSRVTATPLPVPFAPYHRANGPMWKDSEWLASRTDAKARFTLILKIFLLISHHDAGAVPSNFAGIWPQGVHMDFRTVESLGRPDLLHEMNLELYDYLEARPVLMLDLVRRT